MTREVAINVLKSHYHKNPRTSYSLMVKQATEMAIEALNERKTGKWIHGREISREYIGNEIISIQYADWRCSACGMKVADIASSVSVKYCPDCGAKMEADE